MINISKIPNSPARSSFLRRSIRKFNIPPGQPPGHLNFWRLACSNSLPSGQKSRSNAPPISTELPFLKDKFCLQSTLCMPFRKRYAVMTPSNFFERPFWKSYSLTKAKFYPSNPAKTEKNSRAYYVRTTDKSGSNSPPFQGNVQIPSSPGTMHSQMLGVCPGGDVEVSNWSAHFSYIVILVTCVSLSFVFDCYVRGTHAFFVFDCYVSGSHALCFVFDCYVSGSRCLCFVFDCYVSDSRALFFLFDCYVSDLHVLRFVFDC